MQYTPVYCSEKGMRKAVCIAIQTECAGRGAHDRKARGARGSRRGARAATGARLARHGRAAGPAGCALGALGLFLTRFDSVLFLSQFLDIVREPGS